MHDVGQIPARDLESVREAAYRMGISTRQMYRWIENGKVTAYLISNRYMVLRDEIDGLIIFNRKAS